MVLSETLNSTLTLTERYISSSDGGQIFAQAIGNPSLPTLVFIHGLLFSSIVWAQILADTSLLQNFYLIAYDMRGHARSVKPDRPEGYSSRLYADDFNAVTSAFDVKSPILVGWSMGGSVATDVTAYYGADALAGIIFVAGLPWLAANPQVSTPWVLGQAPGLSSVDNSTLAISSRVAFTDNLFRNPGSIPVEVLWSWLGSTNLVEPTKVGFLFGREQNTTNLFKAGASGVPLLLVNGGADKYIMGEKVHEVVKDKFKDLTVHTVKNGSHAFFYEDREEFIGQVRKFAKRVFGKGRR
ncbi:Alpha/Beta hydrolase protein [Ephemerocybe angulata]|uniref:Alpha/Beta hydrolase protein n=1 Tax=Ephemerocybe angulata TaxID=980116 RepID=A0A8H6HMR2_9AGAR|nr:Alpha/Beta hydrolase protein [Tulosesus angulatus]